MPARRLWTVYACRYDPPLARGRRGEPRHSWLRRFYTRAAAHEQAIWCAEAWPDARVGVYRRDDAAFLTVYQPHQHPALPCGCTVSLPPCSLEHAVRVTQ